jgi:hypothetical protein
MQQATVLGEEVHSASGAGFTFAAGIGSLVGAAIWAGFRQRVPTASAWVEPIPSSPAGFCFRHPATATRRADPSASEGNAVRMEARTRP